MPVLSVMDPAQMQAMPQQAGHGGLPPSSPTSGGSKKIQVMKRQNSNGKFDTQNGQSKDAVNNANRKPQVTGVEKEKVYAVTRAQIFGEEGLATSSSTGSLTGIDSPSADKNDVKSRSASQATDLSIPSPGNAEGDINTDGIAARSGSIDQTGDLASERTGADSIAHGTCGDKERASVQSEESSPRTSGSGATTHNTGSSRGTKYSGGQSALPPHSSTEGGAHYVYDKKGQMTPNRIGGSSGKNFYAANHGSSKSLHSGSSPERRNGGGYLSRETSTETMPNGYNTILDSPNPSTRASSTYSRGKKPPDVNSWKEPKYTPRDKDAERSDPDFTRRNAPMPQPIAFAGPQVMPMPMMPGAQYSARYPDGTAMMPPGGMYPMGPMPMPYPMQQVPGGVYPVQYMPGQGQWVQAPYYPAGAPVMGVRPGVGAYPGQPVYDYGQQQVVYYPQQPQAPQQQQQQQPQIPSSPSTRSLRDSRNSNGNGPRDNPSAKGKHYNNGNGSGSTKA